jgi:hypothetical protein
VPAAGTANANPASATATGILYNRPSGVI